MRICVPKIKYQIIFLVVLCGLLVSSSSSAALIGETRNFYVDPSYDLQKREELTSVLVAQSGKLYVFVDTSLWNSFSGKEQNDIMARFTLLTNEFENRIYPILTSHFGVEWIPGIDKDTKITILFHPMRKGAGGYFSEINEYSKFENPNSNEREMIYVNADYLASAMLNGLVAHEFTHLITFSQKERIYKTKEDTWLNETRAEYASTLLGYNDNYNGSYLQRRVNDFLKNPDDSLTEWSGSPRDYGSINLFALYLVDHYGIEILNDSLHYGKSGIESINYALKKNGYQEDFSQIFTNWMVAVLINDCSLGEKYCYTSKNLANFKILPTDNYTLANSPLEQSVNHSAVVWAGNWQRIFTRGKRFTVEFHGALGKTFKVPYVLCDLQNNCSTESLMVDDRNQGEIIIEKGEKYSSLIIIPTLQDINATDDNAFFLLNIKHKAEEPAKALSPDLLEKINFLNSEIIKLQSQIASLKEADDLSCSVIDADLYFGIRDSAEVRCLQGFLKKQGTDIYPEGLITGNFLNFTKSAVSRFQEKYADDILKPLGLSDGTGYVGILTKTKIAELLKQAT